MLVELKTLRDSMIILVREYISACRFQGFDLQFMYREIYCFSRITLNLIQFNLIQFQFNFFVQQWLMNKTFL